MKKNYIYKRYLLTVNGAPVAAFETLPEARSMLAGGRSLGLAIIWDVQTGDSVYTEIEL